MGTRVRLQAIFDMVKAPCVLADIGCDHALLPIMLVKQGKCDKVYACDRNPGPLSRAKQAIEEAQLEDHIVPVLCDGLAGIGDDVDRAVIAGMGFDTIVHILEQGAHKVDQLKQIVIQCNGHVDDFRSWLNTHGYTIDDERIVKDSHYYQLISVHKEVSKPLSKEDCLFGVFLRKDPLFREFWELMLAKKRQVLLQLSCEHENYRSTKEEIQMIEKELEN